MAQFTQAKATRLTLKCNLKQLHGLRTKFLTDEGSIETVVRRKGTSLEEAQRLTDSPAFALLSYSLPDQLLEYLAEDDQGNLLRARVEGSDLGLPTGADREVHVEVYIQDGSDRHNHIMAALKEV